MEKLSTIYKLFLGLIIIIMINQNVYSQKFENWAIEKNLFVGKIVVHTPKINFDAKGITSYGTELNLKYKTFGKQKWNQYQRYPELGISLVYFNFGENDFLGHTIGLMPNISINIIDNPKGFFQYKFGWGLAYLTKSYHPIHNTINNAIGSKWNTIAYTSFDGGIKINPRWSVQAGIGLTHYSNGATQLPNLGTNIAEGHLGVAYTPFPSNKNIFHDDYLNIPDKRWGLELRYDMGFHETVEPRGPRFPVYIGAVSGIFNFNRVNRAYLGYELEYNTSAYHYLYHYNYNADESYAKNQAVRHSLYFADEILFGDIGLKLLIGIYIKKKERVPKQFYNKLVLRYYFPPIGKPKTRFFIAAYLKTHLSVAEHFSFGIGANL